MRRTLFALALFAAACSDSPARPSPVADATPALVGQWRGLFEITACSGDCTGRTTAEFMLTFVSIGDRLEGLLVLLDNERTTVNVSGVRTADGSYQFGAVGYDEPTVESFPVRTVVSSLACRTDAAAGLVGSMTYTNQTFRTIARTVEFRSAVRQLSSERPGRFDGAWQGYYRAISCSGNCQVGGGGYNYPTGGHLGMTFSEAGAQVVGSVMSSPVTGATQSDALSASGPALTPDACQTCWDCEGVCQSAVQDVSARVDKLGRLSGTFVYSLKGWTGREHFRQVMLVEMIGVTRRW